MTEPTLTDWHTLYTTTRERFPDAPGLPEGYRISDHVDYGETVMQSGSRREGVLYITFCSLDTRAAFCVMLDWAMRFGAWWADQTPEFDDDYTIRGGENRCQAIYNSEKRLWAAYSSRLVSPGTETHAKQVWEDYSEHPSHHAAYFAAVQAIVGGE
jgi:hypothetical protein